MDPAGLRKIALLLLSLDPTTASELLQGQSPDVVQEIAMELAKLDANKEYENEEKIEVAREFYASLQDSSSGNLNVKSFVNRLMSENAENVEAGSSLMRRVQEKDPFISICSYNPGLITAALEGEHPQTMAIVLQELPPKVSTEVLKRMDEEMASSIITRMTMNEEVPFMVKRRVGEMISKRLSSMNPDEEVAVQETRNRQNLRGVAIVLSGLDKQFRDTLLEEIEVRDESTGKMVRSLLVTWEDITKISDKSLQLALRNVDPNSLAKALVGCDERVSTKIRNNISERASAMVDEEAALIGKPSKKEIMTGREAVVKPLREANEKEELDFVEE